eukprot:390246_1
MAEISELREGNYSVKVIDRERHSPVPLVVHNREVYVIAELGREFEVEMQVFGRRFRVGKNFIFDLDVDTRNVGYWKEINVGSLWKTKFSYFNVKDGSKDFRNLKFDIPSRLAYDEYSPKRRRLEDLGTIEVKFTRAYIPNGRCPPGCPGITVHAPSREALNDRSLLDDVEDRLHVIQRKKVAMLRKKGKRIRNEPELFDGVKVAVVPGTPTEVTMRCAYNAWGSEEVVKKIKIFYNTAAALRSRGVLTPDTNPAHRRFFCGAAESESSPSGSVLAGAWLCGVCFQTNGPRANECMFCVGGP